METEIKEILEDVKIHLDYVEATKQASIRDNEMKAMYDYIINLEQENEKLKEVINDDMATYLKGLEDGKDKMKECYNSVYKSRIDKAIEYIKSTQKFNKGCDINIILNKDYLLNILGGDE